ncbi:uncharacterized protein LOC129792226 isoform X3 [Lutzomyia longipalpis]|uniref:uncharacterized protein LOC129792226 isoform X3 n=1 Tax=Lutzomyia longipalpis TaxID=7200 RepID=UPI0024845F9A|nr:uncharacterized protein LOC129792226 isoform X3 [Lutzomyia longipalpis]
MIMFYMPRLKVRDKIFKLAPGFNIIGSQEASSEHSIVLNDATIDGKHAVVRFDPIKNVSEVMDLLSRGGTVIDKTPLPTLEWRDLQHGQTILFGTETATFLTEIGRDSTDVQHSGNDYDQSDVIPVSQIVQFPPRRTYDVIVPDTQDEETEPESAIEDVTLPETQHPGTSLCDTDLDTLERDISMAIEMSEKQMQCIPETQDVSEGQKSVQEHIDLPETQITKSQRSPGNSLGNFIEDDDWDYPTEPFIPLGRKVEAAICDSQDLLGMAEWSSTERMTEKKLKDVSPESPLESEVMNKSRSHEVSQQLIIPNDDGDDTDCEEELITAIEVKVEQTSTPIKEPPCPQQAPMQPFVSIPRVNSIYDVETQPNDPPAAEEHSFLVPKLPFVKVPRINPAYYVETQPQEPVEVPKGIQEAKLLTFPKNSSLDVAYQAATQLNENPIEGSIFSDFSSTDELSDLSTPPCAIKLPTKTSIACFLKNKPKELKRKASAPLLFPESDSEDDFGEAFGETSQNMKEKTPQKTLSAATRARLRDITILNSPDVFESQDVAMITKPRKKRAKTVKFTVEPEKDDPPKSPNLLAGDLSFYLTQQFSFPDAPEEEAQQVRELAECAWKKNQTNR